MRKEGYIALVGLGAIGAPLANLLLKKYKERFVLLASDEIAKELKKHTLYINGNAFVPRIISQSDSFEGYIDYLFVCVKNYSLVETTKTISPFINNDTIIVPLQNGVFSYNYFRETFPENTVIECFAQGPNTRIFENNFVYQTPGEYHIGKNEQSYKHYAEKLYDVLRSASVPCCLDDNIRHSVWKKMMLNVAGNALTALTDLDYIMFKNSPEAQRLCLSLMNEYAKVAETADVKISNEDIQSVIDYFVNFNKPKHTSMLEDVLNQRETENEYIAGYIKDLAKQNSISTPYIDTIYSLMKIKEDVYLGRLD